MRKLNTIISLITAFVFVACSIDHSSNSQNSNTALLNAPDWAKEVVWYQIFVERFRNGDPNNDPTQEDIEGGYPGFIPENWQITPWTHDWYKPNDFFTGLDGTKDFAGHPIKSFNQKSQIRRYGGDLQGVLDKIDYLDSLGVTAVYFNPLNDSPSLHKYDARHWRHIDRNFGPTPREDVEIIAKENPEDPLTWQMTGADKMFVHVIKVLHERGIRVILDYSWNHTGHTFWAWKDLVKNGVQSKYKDWYWVKKFDDPDTPENEFEYRGWLGIVDLPEIKETAHQDIEKGIRAFEGDIASQAVIDHIFSVTRRWLDPDGDGDPSDGVDGFRLDVAVEVPLEFWRDYRKFVRNIQPDAYLLGEVWWEKYPDHLLDPKPYLEGDIFDAVMNYRWYRAARHFFNASPMEITVSEFVDSLQSFSSNLRKQNIYAMMNLTASHDTPRVGTSLFNKNKYKYQTSPGADNKYKIHKPDAETYQTLRLLLAQQYSYVGAPHIWAGDEMGMWGADDPNTRKPLIWPDYQFEPETTHPLGMKRPRDEVKFNKELFNYYRKLIRIRRENPVLIHGDIDFVLVDDKNKILAYKRFDDKNEALALFNVSQEQQTVKIPVKSKQGYMDVLSGIDISPNENAELAISLMPRSAAILVINHLK